MTVGINAPFGLRPIMSSVGGGWDGRTTDYAITASANGVTTDATSLYIGDPVQILTTQASYLTTGNTLNHNAKKNYITRYVPNYQVGANTNAATFADTPVVGVFQGCSYESTQTMVNNVANYPIWPGATQVVPGTTPTAKIIDDFTVIYEIQISTNIDADANTNAFIASPTFPVINTIATGTPAHFPRSGVIGSSFALMIGGGTNFDTVNDAWTAINGQYLNNPVAGNPITFQSAFYLDVSTASVVGGASTNEYIKGGPRTNNNDLLPLKLIGYSDSVEALAATPLTLDTTPFLTMKVRLNNQLYSAGTVGTALI